MVGPVAQMVSLVSHGNDYFTTKNENKKFKQSSTFQFCRFVTFKAKTANKTIFGNNEIIIGEPYEWFRHLKDDGCLNLRLLYKKSENKSSLKDYMTAGFIGGGGQWFIEAVYHDKSVLWASKWVLNKFGEQDNRIWEVTYMNVNIINAVIEVEDNLIACKKKLLESLNNIEKLAVETDRKEWVDRFKAATIELNSDEPNRKYYTDLIIEKNYSLTARQILAGVQKAWVFGGMGWWNDFIYEDKERQTLNDILSEKLYYNICNSIVLAANSYQADNTL